MEGIYGRSLLTDSTIQLFLNYGCIFFIPSSLLFGWWLDQPNGLRGCTLSGYGLVIVAAVLRLVAGSNATKSSLILLHAAFIVNAIAGPVAMGAVSKLSENWFPPKQRTTATAIAAQSNLLGTAAAFSIGPLMVPHADAAANQHYVLLILILASVGGVASLVYFPSRPPLPPSVSAAASAAPGGHHYSEEDDRGSKSELRESHEAEEGGEPLLQQASKVVFPVSTAGDAVTVKAIVRSLGKLLRNRNFLVLLVAYGLAQGMSSAWGSTLTLNLQGITGDKDKAQFLGGWISFSMTILGVFASLAAGRIVDRYRNHRTVIIVGLAMASVFLAYFALLSQRVLPPSINSGEAGIAQTFAAATIAGLFMSSIIPVLFEIGVESTFSIAGEGLTVMVLTLANNIGGLLLLFIPLDSAAAAFNWVFFGTVAGAALLCWMFLRNANERASLDVSGSAGGITEKSAETVVHAAFSTDGSTAITSDGL
jgi:MFS transporter, FLVCR family, disrupted in renal carcinoma protein 2